MARIRRIHQRPDNPTDDYIERYLSGLRTFAAILAGAPKAEVIEFKPKRRKAA